MLEHRRIDRPVGIGAFRAILIGVGLALTLVGPTVAAPSSNPGTVVPGNAGHRHDTATMSGSDLGGGEYEFGTLRLDTYWNTSHQWTKETIRFNMYGLAESTGYRARIHVGTCEDYLNPYRISISVSTNAAGRLIQTKTLSSAQRAILRGWYDQHKPIAIDLTDTEGSTGGVTPCGVLWVGR
jgi:hypothetical protein